MATKLKREAQAENAPEFKKFDFWKDNKVDQHHHVYASEIVDHFITTPQYSWYLSADWPLERALSVVIANEFGVWEEKDWSDIYDAVRDELKRRKKI